MTEKKNVLVVDDDSRWITTITRILKNDYNIESAIEPDRAIALIKTNRFSLAILDQRMPEMTGVNLLRKLREIQHDLNAIILTGHADVDDAVFSMKTGALDYISKGNPNLAGELRRRVAEAIEKNVAVLIEQREGAGLEFKSSLRWDMRQNQMNRDLEKVIVKTIAGFLNSDDGGTLLIGVDDDGKCLGLKNDYQTLKKKDRDGFETHLTGLLLDAYGKDVIAFIHIDFDQFDGNDVCRVTLRPSTRAVFVPDGAGGEHLYIRTGNATRLLSTREAIDYCRMRWK